jgi:uncharacterized DUF497 family protein
VLLHMPVQPVAFEHKRWAATLPDPDHSEREERVLILGRSAAGRFLITSATECGDRIRLISARLMTPRERRSYERSLEL